MSDIDVTSVARKLIGPISPVGETNADKERLANLERLIVVVDRLLDDIQLVASYEDRAEYSMSHAGYTARKFLNEVKEGI